MPEAQVKRLSALRTNEARLLATMLRTSRLTWLFAVEGTDKSAVLRLGVLPQLRRRHQDGLGASAAAAGVDARPIGAGDRRSGAAGGAEVVLYVDRWSGNVVEALKSSLVMSLPSHERSRFSAALRLASLVGDIESALGLNLFFVFDNFERFFDKSSEPDSRAAFVDEWSEAVSLAGLRAGFLVALDEGCRPRLDTFRRRVPDLDHNAMRLLPEPGASQTALAKPVGLEPRAKVATAASGKLRAQQAAPRSPRSPTPTPIKVEEVYAFIESTLAKTAVQPPDPAWSDGTAAIDAGIPVLSLHFSDEDYLSPNHSGENGTASPQWPDELSPARAPTTARRLANALKRLGGRHKS